MPAEDSDPAREALTVTLTALACGLTVGAIAWAAWITVQLTQLIRALATLAEAIANQPL